jgi:hypothetical protein
VGKGAVVARPVGLAAVAALMALLAIPALAGASVFASQKLDLNPKMYDLGVTDFNQDGNLDLFTTNHKYLQSLLAGDGHGGFQDRLAQLGLSQTAEFPGYEDLLSTPDTSSPGLYIYSERGSGIHVQLSGEPQGVTGQIRFVAGNVEVTRHVASQVSVSRDETADPVTTTVAFTAQDGANIVIKNTPQPLPVDVSIDQPQPASLVLVGAQAVPATSREFTLYLRDRHGMAWGDYDGDGSTDIFIARGGLHGKNAGFEHVISDELMLSSGGGFVNATSGSGLHKGVCRGRQALSFDYNHDGLLDLFEGCAGGAPPKLWRAKPDGTFANASSGLRRAGVQTAKNQGTSFRWLDVDGNRHQDLLSARSGRFFLYEQAGRRWRERQLISGRQGGKIETLALGDFDGDGDPDVYAASSGGSTLLVDRRGRLHARNPSSVGLPGSAQNAAWVDYNDDGLPDLHVLPGGLFRQTARGDFKRTKLIRSSGRATNALAAWPDVNNDGARDAVTAVRRGGQLQWRSRLFTGHAPRNHWLEVDLAGPPGNAQGIGARVTMHAGPLTQTQWVGQSDVSRYSQGHYRLYFGLRHRSQAHDVVAQWSPGEHTTVRPVDADQVITIPFS